jgi:hypothetical protein
MELKVGAISNNKPPQQHAQKAKKNPVSRHPRALSTYETPGHNLWERYAVCDDGSVLVFLRRSKQWHAMPRAMLH